MLEQVKIGLLLLWEAIRPSEETQYSWAAASMMCEGYTDLEIEQALGPDPRNSTRSDPKTEL